MQKVFLSLIIFMCSFLMAETMTIAFNNGDTLAFDTAEILEITFENVSVDDMVELMSQIPIGFLKNSPNPFNPTTTISFELSESGKTQIEIFNVKGQKVKTLLDEEMEIGKHSVTWSGTDGNNRQAASGIYFYRISVNNKQKINKMIMLK